MVSGKSRFKFFLPQNLFFNPILTQNILEIVINLYMTSKNRSKNQNQPKLKSFFFMNFKGKKTPNMNFPRQMKLFDTNIICFGSLYRCQLHVSLSTIGIQLSLSLSTRD
jgi:hypothetical protein